MFGIGRIKPGDYVFAVRKETDSNIIIIGRVQSASKKILSVIGSSIKPSGLLKRKLQGKIGKRSNEVLNDPDPDNCIFILIDRIESENFSGQVNQETDKVTWINENRYIVLDGWIKENLSDMFANVIHYSEDRTHHARSVLIEKMNSIYERDLKDHVYAVVRSTKIL